MVHIGIVLQRIVDQPPAATFPTATQDSDAFVSFDLPPLEVESNEASEVGALPSDPGAARSRRGRERRGSDWSGEGESTVCSYSTKLTWATFMGADRDTRVPIQVEISGGRKVRLLAQKLSMQKVHDYLLLVGTEWKCDPAAFVPLGARLGVGSFGTVELGTYLRTRVAAKELLFSDEARFRREAALLSHLHHPNVVTMIGLLEAGEQRHAGEPADDGTATRDATRPAHAKRGPRLVMEWCAGGTLRTQMKRHGAGMTSLQRHWVLEQVLNAVYYLSSKGVVHNDVKSANIFFVQAFDPLWDEFPSVKVGDFGQAATAAERSICFGTTKNNAEKYYWIPPEAWHAPPAAPKLTDAWAFGMLVLEVLGEAGHVPAAREVLREVWRLVADGEPVGQRLATAGWARDLVHDCLQKDAMERADIEHISHKWQYLRSSALSSPQWHGVVV